MLRSRRWRWLLLPIPLTLALVILVRCNRAVWAPPPPPPTTTSWNPHRDRNSHTLTSAQCHAAFPLLYTEIQRSQAYWRARLRPHDQPYLTRNANWNLHWSANASFRALIYHHQLYVLETKNLTPVLHWRERALATLHMLHRAVITSPEPVPDIEFSVKIKDTLDMAEETTGAHANVTVWSFNRRVDSAVQQQVWLLPDFNFWAYPRTAGAWEDFQRRALALAEEDVERKLPELVWRGTVEWNPDVRKSLLEHSEGESWSAVREVIEDLPDKDWRISLPDHCKYQFAAHTEGISWSGRLKYLLSCHSTVLIHPLTYTTHYYHLLEAGGPRQNYVPCRADWSDLKATMAHLLQHPADARRIADNAATIFRDRYLTPAAQTCYLRELFRAWADMTEAPSPYVDGEGGDAVWRDMLTFEEYVFWNQEYTPES